MSRPPLVSPEARGLLLSLFLAGGATSLAPPVGTADPPVPARPARSRSGGRTA